MTKLSQNLSDLMCLKKNVIHLEETGDEYRPFLDLVGDANLVLLGEATHGTHEFYRERAQISKQLIKKKGFKAIAIEGDWPDAYRVHRYVTGLLDDEEASDALRGFTRFPSWMWANADVLDFVAWLKNYNDNQERSSRPIGFYGLDLYSLFRSIGELIAYLENVDPAAAERALQRLECLDHFNGDSQKYAYATGLGLTKSCEDAVVSQLTDLLNEAQRYSGYHKDPLAHDEYFNALQNTRLIRAAEQYYRLMIRDDVSSWNLRDRHMAETIAHIRQHLIDHNEKPKLIVWAHNSHVGDARATEMSKRGEFNIGQVTKELYATDCISLGFTTYEGTVTAASNWDGAAERKKVRLALDETYEKLFHEIGLPRFYLGLEKHRESTRILREPRLERAIGVIYRPDSERMSHYFFASLAEQFDAIIHIDRTRAVAPIEHQTHWDLGTEAPESYPTGL